MKLGFSSSVTSFSSCSEFQICSKLSTSKTSKSSKVCQLAAWSSYLLPDSSRSIWPSELPFLTFQEAVIAIYFKNDNSTETWHPTAARPHHCRWMAPLHPAPLHSAPLLGTPHTDPTAFSSQFQPFVSPSSAQATLFLRLERSSPSSPNAPDTILSRGEPVPSLYRKARAEWLPRVCV